MKKIKNIVLFASGNGSNAENIYFFFKNHNYINVKLLFCNNKNAFAIDRCTKIGLDYFLFTKDDFVNNIVLEKLLLEETDYIVLAGFLWLIPEVIIEAFPNRIINIHPALLPKYGGKGMYGDNVHKAVFYSNEKETGITVHFVDKVYDSGNIIFQKSVLIDKNDTIESIANKVHRLEYSCYPSVIEDIIINSKNY